MRFFITEQLHLPATKNSMMNNHILKASLLFLCLLMAIPAVDAQQKKRKSRAKPKVAATVTNKTKVFESKMGEGSITADSTLVPLYSEAANWLRTPYRRGGTSERGMDCSGLTGTIVNNVFGIKLQRSSRDIAVNDVHDLKKADLMPGDLVFFSTRSYKSKRINHVGVYLGNNHFVHASCSNGVIISNLNEPYYLRSWVKGGRVKDLVEKIEPGIQPEA